MKKKCLIKYEVISTIAIIVLGILLHFSFEWTSNNNFVGIFSAVNESVWEHLKILFFPMLVSSLVGYSYFKKEISNYLCYKTKGIIVSLLLVVVLHYTYSGIIGTHIAVIDISIFILSILLGQFISYKSIIENNNCNNKISIILLIILTLSFVVFTFYPPHIGIFKDPQDNYYGIKKE